MCAKYIASQHKHPQTPKQTQRIMEHRNDYIAWAIKILDEQRQTLQDHMHRIQGTFSGSTFAPRKHVRQTVAYRPPRQTFIPPKPRRRIG
jgi:hypothetical protein